MLLAIARRPRWADRDLYAESIAETGIDPKNEYPIAGIPTRTSAYRAMFVITFYTGARVGSRTSLLDNTVHHATVAALVRAGRVTVRNGFAYPYNTKQIGA